MDDPASLEEKGIKFLWEHILTPGDLIDELQGMERRIIRRVYAGIFVGHLYRLYELTT